MLTAFYWIIDRQLAGSGRPGLLTDLADDLTFVEQQGIRTIISLTEDRLDLCRHRDTFDNPHFPIPDMGFPTPRFAGMICEQVFKSMSHGPVLLHCHAGLGRTGTLAACCLIALGERPERALAWVRSVNRRYVQTRSHEQFIHHFARYVRERGTV